MYLGQKGLVASLLSGEGEKTKKTWKVHAWISKTLADWKVKLIWRRSLCDRTVSSFVKGSWANNKLINRFINPGCGFRKVREELTNVLKFWYHQWEAGAEKYNLFCCDIVLSNMRNILRYFKEFNLKSYQMSHSEFFLLWQLHENILRMIFLKTFLVKNSPGSLGGICCIFLQAVIEHRSTGLSNVHPALSGTGRRDNK